MYVFSVFCTISNGGVARVFMFCILTLIDIWYPGSRMRCYFFHFGRGNAFRVIFSGVVIGGPTGRSPRATLVKGAAN